MSPTAMPPHVMFAERITHDGDHWIWTGHLAAGRHPQIGWKEGSSRRRVPARVYAWLAAGHELPPRKIVTSTCGESLCVNPQHAEAVSLSVVHTEPDEVVARRFWSRLDRSTECWLWTGSSKGREGYGSTHFRGKNILTHRLAYLLAHGELPTGRTLYVCHHCDTPLCCRPDHLYIGTPAQNSADRERRNRANRVPAGSGHPGCKLTVDQVAEIRAKYAAGGTSYPKLGEEYGVHLASIGRIIRGEGYADVA